MRVQTSTTASVPGAERTRNELSPANGLLTAKVSTWPRRAGATAGADLSADEEEWAEEAEGSDDPTAYETDASVPANRRKLRR